MQGGARIHRLPPLVANQIAAGEVVERPASVLKELLENSLDAGATDIEVSVESGGMRTIRVRDNGHGIHKEDLQLALTRHATSKVRKPSDLNCIGSLGFRGEALASIASVAKVSLTSKWREAKHAWRVFSQADGSPPQVEPASLPEGTQVEVRELFYNTPARRRFLKSERTEFQHIQDSVTRLALSHTHVAITLKHNGRPVIRLPAACSPEEERARLGRLLGKAFLREAVPLEFRLDAWMLSGWLATPDFHRSQTDMQHFFVNGRPVRDRLVMHAMREAYQSLIPAGRSPAYVLYFVLPGDQVDVNVHPTKHEVRFHQSRSVHDFIVHAVRETVGDMVANPTGSQVVDAATVAEPSPPQGAYAVREASLPRPASRANAWGWQPPARTDALPWLLQESFWLGESDGKLWLVDAALLWSSMTNMDTRHFPTQPLLCPWRWCLPDSVAKSLQRAGWVMEDADGQQAWVVLSIPSLLTGVDPSVLHRWVRGLSDWPENPPEAWLRAGRTQIQTWLPLLPEELRKICVRPVAEGDLRRLFEGG